MPSMPSLLTMETEEETELVYHRPPVSRDQQEFLDSGARILFWGTGTKTGKTVGGAIWIMEGLLQGMRCAWIGPWHKRTRTGFEHIRGMLKDFEKAGFAKCRESDLRVTVFLPEDRTGVCEFFSGDNPDAVYGEAFDRIFIDEATRQPEGILPAARSTVTATGGQIRIAFNTDRGARHWAIREFLRAKRGEEPTYGYMTMPTSRSPYVAKEDVEQARRMLPERVFEALYNAVISEDGAGVFVNPRACFAGTLQEPQLGKVYVAGVDLARKHDFTVITVMDAYTHHVVHWDRFHDLPWHMQRDRIAAIARHYNHAKLCVDATGLGDPNIEELVRDGLLVEGFVFTNQTKRELIERLVVALEKKQISFPEEGTGTLIGELESFEYQTTAFGNITYSAPDGYKDDAVLSLALCVRLLGPLTAYREVETGRPLMETENLLMSSGAFACL